MNRLRIFKRISALLIFAATALTAQDRSLFWERLESDAFLDSEGSLHVTEIQTIVFDGDYNGGERRFPLQLSNPQAGLFVKLNGMDRLEGDAWVPLRFGNLERVHHYEYDQWGGLVRWRARLPSDSPFRGERLVYRLKFVWPVVLRREDSRIVLKHDFAFPDREGMIKVFRTRLRVDPVWTASEAFNDWIEAGPLLPGTGFVRTVSFDIPSNVPLPYKTHAEKVLYKLSALGVVPLLVLFFLWFARREKATGLAVDPAPPDQTWMRDVFLNHPPEVIADACGSPDHILSTLLLRLQTGKLLDFAGGAFLRLGDGHGEEKKFLDRLFPSGKSEATADEIAAYRQKNKFGEIRWDAWSAAYNWRSEHKIERYDPDVRWFARPVLWMFAFLFFLVPAFAFTDLAAVEFAGLLTCVLLALPWMRSQKAGRGPFVRTSTIAFCHAILLLAGIAALPVLTAAVLWLLPLTLLVCFASLLSARSVRSRQVTLYWEELVARGRTFFEQALKKQQVLEESWAPYLLALGLSATSTMRAPLPAETAAGQRTAGSSGSASDDAQRTRDSANESGPSSAGPAAGSSGGRFGGAGATVSWAESLTAASRAASTGAGGSSGTVSASSDSGSDSSSSSDSSSDSSGSSSSSGGGGGGGW